MLHNSEVWDLISLLFSWFREIAPDLISYHKSLVHGHQFSFKNQDTYICWKREKYIVNYHQNHIFKKYLK